MNDLTIRNVLIHDGLGGEPRPGDVGIADGRITEVGSAAAGTTEIDGQGRCLAPGFIDTHSHDDGAFFRYPGMEFKLAQGVTTVVAGNCGFSAIPLDPDVDPARASGGILAGLEGSFTDLDGYFAAALERRPGINNMMLVGHNTVRTLVMGYEKRAPTAAELAAMKSHVRAALEQGACGFSTGLIYRPGRWSDTDEVIELAAEASATDALYTTHMRNEGDHLLEAVDEALTIGREGGVHLHISHHKSAGPANWGDMMVGSDGIPDLKGQPHPRLFGTFPRILAKYVREDGVLTLPEAIRRMTSLPARVFGMTDRGVISPGNWADLVVFDPAEIQDRATYDEPKTEPAGISLVVINGQVGFREGRHLHAGSGKLLRFNRSAFGE